MYVDSKNPHQTLHDGNFAESVNKVEWHPCITTLAFSASIMLYITTHTSSAFFTESMLLIPPQPEHFLERQCLFAGRPQALPFEPSRRREACLLLRRSKPRSFAQLSCVF